MAGSQVELSLELLVSQGLVLLVGTSHRQPFRSCYGLSARLAHHSSNSKSSTSCGLIHSSWLLLSSRGPQNTRGFRGALVDQSVSLGVLVPQGVLSVMSWQEGPHR